MFKAVGKIFGSSEKEEPKRRKRNITRPAESRAEAPVSENSAPTKADIQAGRDLFWGRAPHYPKMGPSYRTVLQRFKVDNQRILKVHDVTCGADICDIASGAGPNIEYQCTDEDQIEISKVIDKFGLSKKIDRVLETASPREYFAQIISLNPQDIDDAVLDWDHFGETTSPGGLVIIMKEIDTTTSTWSPKPSEKISDTNEFYYYNQVDHSGDWIKSIEMRLKAVGEMEAEKFSSLSAQVVSAFKIEASEWMLMLQRLKSGELKIVSAIYKHDDV